MLVRIKTCGLAGLDLPIPGGRLNRGGDLRNQTRPGGQTETLPTRPMLARRVS
jgi:hypothetical protein